MPSLPSALRTVFSGWVTRATHTTASVVDFYVGCTMGWFYCGCNVHKRLETNTSEGMS